MKKITYLLILLISSYQFLGVLDPNLGGCHIQGFDCSGITSSSYGSLAGIPLSLLGIFWSSVALALNESLLLLALNIMGLLMAVYSVSVMGLILHRWCLWCLIIDINLTVAAGLSLLQYQRSLGPFKKTTLLQGLFLGCSLPLLLAGYHRFKTPPINLDVVLSLDSPLLLGNINGPNTLIVFTDFQCPACKRASDIVQSFSKRGDTKIIIKNYPLSNECNNSVNHNMHPWSCLAAMASVCAFEQGKFDEFYHTVYGNQASIHTKDELLRTLSFTSLDMNQLVGCIKGSWAENKVQQDIQAGNKINLQGTPTIYYNQKPVALDEFLQEK